MPDILNTSLTGLRAFQSALATTSHNIANVNTEGYSRQRVDLSARIPEATSVGFIGSGVQVADVSRSYDAYLATRVRDYTSSYQEFNVYEQRARQIDNVIADAAAGIDSMLQQFFASVNDVADDPTSIPARTVMINRATQLSDRFAALDGWFEDLRHQVDQDLERQASEINSIAQSLADLNSRIRNLAGASNGAANDLLDDRDRLIDELSQYTSVSTLEQSDGTMNVFIGTGQALVVGTTFNSLGVINNPLAADHKELVIQQAGTQPVMVTKQMVGGTLGGLIRFRDEVLDESHNALGRVAIGVAALFNEEHRTGMDLDGELGSEFFRIAAPQVMPGATNGGSLDVGFDSVSDLTTHEYRLDFDGSSWSLSNTDTGSTVPLSGAGTVANPFVADGMSIVINSAVAGDTYRLRPTAGAPVMSKSNTPRFGISMR